MGEAVTGQQQAIGYDPETGRAVIGYDPNTGKAVYQSQTPSQPTQQPGIGQQLLDQATRMGRQVASGIVEPVKAVARGVYGAAQESAQTGMPMTTTLANQAIGAVKNTAAGLGQAQAGQFDKAREAANQGDYQGAIAHGAAYLVPILGPMLDDMQSRVRGGQSAEVAGDLVTMFLMPNAAKRTPAISSRGMQRLNPTEAQAMNWAVDQGLPVTAGAATGNPALNAASQSAERMTVLGGMSGMNRANRMEAGLASIGEQLAEKANPVPATLSGAGRSTITAGQRTAATRAAEATSEYSALRSLESADPAKFAVDIRTAQQALEPMYKELLEDSSLVPLQGARADALLVLNRLMKAPNTVSLSTADQALGDLKRIVRRQGRDGMTSGGQNLAQILDEVEAQVTGAASADPRALSALQSGRKATVLRHQALDFLEDVVNRRGTNIASDAIGRKDSGIELIRSLQKVSPEVVPEIGRAFLDDLMESATADGGFKGAQGLLSKWRNMGPETKQALFADALKKDPNYLKDLDNFFLAANRATQNVNTSGSSFTGGAAMHMLQMATLQNPALSAAIEASGLTASRLLSNPKVVRLLTRGFSIPTSATAAKTATAAAIMKALELGQSTPSRAQGAGPMR